jgi:hypothetical protein
MRRFVFIRLSILSLSVLAAGCSREGTVSGKIYHKGEPLKGGTVNFFPEGSNNAHPAIIGMDGSYTVSKLPRGPAKIGVQVGTQGVPASVFNRMGGKGIEKGLKQMGRIGRGASGGGESADAAEAKDQAKDKAKDAIPKEDTTALQKYADPEKSGLKIDVTGGSQTHDIKLE